MKVALQVFQVGIVWKMAGLSRGRDLELVLGGVLRSSVPAEDVDF
jgi:hypothetical protein